MASPYYSNETVANVVEKNIENFAKNITDSYFQTHPDVKMMDPETYAQTYYTVFREALREVEKQIAEVRKQNEKIENIL